MPYKKFFYSTIIEEKYLDMFHHVNNAAYLVLFETARWDLITQGGYGVDKIKETGLAPTILEIKLSFLKEICLNDKITIETELLFYKNKIGKLSQKIVRNNEVCCESEFTIGLFDLQKRKLALPTAEWLTAIGYERHDTENNITISE